MLSESTDAAVIRYTPYVPYPFGGSRLSRPLCLHLLCRSHGWGLAEVHHDNGLTGALRSLLDLP